MYRVWKPAKDFVVLEEEQLEAGCRKTPENAKTIKKAVARPDRIILRPQIVLSNNRKIATTPNTCWRRLPIVE